MPLDSRHLRIIKHPTKSTKNLVCAIIPGLVIQATAKFALPFLFQRSIPQAIPQAMRTSSLSGGEYINEVMTCRNPRRIQEVLRMKLEVFQFLCSELQNKGGLAPSGHIGVEEQVAMFLYAIAHSHTNREVQERFQHSGETVSRHFHAVLQALNRLVPSYINLPNESQIPTTIATRSFIPFSVIASAL